MFVNGNFKAYIQYLRKNTQNLHVVQFRLAQKSILKEIVYALKNMAMIFYKIKTSTLSDYSILSISPSIDHNEVEKIYKLILEIGTWEYHSINFLSQIKNKLFDICFFAKSIDNSYDIMQALYKELDQPLVLSIASVDLSALIGEVAMDMKFENYLISHGSHTWNHDSYANNEHLLLSYGLINSDTYSSVIVQSPLALEFLNQNKINKKIVLSKPIGWGMTFSKRKDCILSEKKIVLHAGTPKPIMRPIVYETDFEYIRSICDTYEAIKNLDDTILYVRFRPNCNISIDTMNYCLPKSDKIKVVTDKTFGYYLKGASMLVSYSSTTIEESLQENIPVILYGNAGQYKHISQYDNDYVWHASNKAELKATIQSILTKGTPKGINKYIFKDSVIFTNIFTKK